MIKNLRHRGLKLLHEKGQRKGLDANLVDKIIRILSRLDVAEKPTDLNLPGWKLHQLKGALTGFWSIHVNANWRIIFRFEDGNIVDVDFVDYH